MPVDISHDNLERLLALFVNAETEEVVRFKVMPYGNKISIFVLRKKGDVCSGCKGRGVEYCDHLYPEMAKIEIIIGEEAEIVEEEAGPSEEDAMPMSETDPTPMITMNKHGERVARLSKDPFNVKDNWNIHE